MHCPYHPDSDAEISVPTRVEDHLGWIGWLNGCCGLPAWRCPEGALLPAEAAFCTYHGCPRPSLDRVAHEVGAATVGERKAKAPPLMQRPLELAPQGGGVSTPCLAGNVLVYLTDNGRLVALDLGGENTIFLAAQVQVAALKVEDGQVVGALRNAAGVRYLAWDVRDLRDALREGSAVVPPVPAPGTRVHLLGLPAEGSVLHQGAGMLRLEVVHDPVPDEVAESYQKLVGAAPGEWLIRRTPNPLGPPVYHPTLRPHTLHQVPVPVPGGLLMLGQVRWRGTLATGAVLVPTIGGQRVAA